LPFAFAFSEALAGRLSAAQAEEALRKLEFADEEEFDAQLKLAQEAAATFFAHNSGRVEHSLGILDQEEKIERFSLEDWTDWESLDVVLSRLASAGFMDADVVEKLARKASQLVVAHRSLKPQAAGTSQAPNKCVKRNRSPSPFFTPMAAPKVKQQLCPDVESDWIMQAAAAACEATDPIVAKTEELARKARAHSFAKLKSLAQNLPQRPPLDANLWPVIAMNEYVDFAVDATVLRSAAGLLLLE
jgi:hypothetical protein